MFDLGAYVKSAEGKARILSQIPFVADGKILQGYGEGVFEADESQVTDKELLAYDDVDGTKEQVWFRRRQRQESRVYNKKREYEKRRRELRSARNDLLDSLERDKKMGIDPNPADLAEIREIDARMANLLVITDRMTVDESVLPKEVKPKDEIPERVECSVCGELSPEGHKSPRKWKRGHEMGQHANPRKVAS